MNGVISYPWTTLTYPGRGTEKGEGYIHIQPSALYSRHPAHTAVALCSCWCLQSSHSTKHPTMSILWAQQVSWSKHCTRRCSSSFSSPIKPQPAASPCCLRPCLPTADTPSPPSKPLAHLPVLRGAQHLPPSLELRDLPDLAAITRGSRYSELSCISAGSRADCSSLHLEVFAPERCPHLKRSAPHHASQGNSGYPSC